LKGASFGACYDPHVRLGIPSSLLGLIKAVKEAGGRPFIVGGAVRDQALGIPFKDYDIEVFGLEPSALKTVLASLGKVDTVGEAFTVFKLSGLEGLDGTVDVSVPRRDSKVGPGHRGMMVMGDPHLSIEEAARRRDFTMNALLLDTASGEVLDPHGGLKDIREKRLRAVDPATFPDDPLRALRGVQLAARYELDVDPLTARLCAQMPLRELPPERVFSEMEKLLLKARRPSIGLRLLLEWKLLASVAPELAPTIGTPQDPRWHPEGDVWIHTLLAVDEAAKLVGTLERPRALSVMLAVVCHDLGKPATTKFEDGRLRSRGHEEAGLGPTLSLLERWNVQTLMGYDVRSQVLGLVGNHLKPGQLYDDRERVSDGAIRRLARKCEPELLYLVARADCLGRVGEFPPVAMEWFLEKIRSLDVARHPPQPFLRGRDLLQMGVKPGPEMGQLIRAVYEMQLDGSIKNDEEARAEAARLIEDRG